MRTLSGAFCSLILLLLVAVPASDMAGSMFRRPGTLQDGTLVVSTELVLVDTVVLSKRDGLPVRNLDRDDFEIYEDGVRQPIRQLGVDNAPLSVVFLFDMTDSVRPVLQSLSQGAVQALGHLKADDEIAVLLYSARADLIQGFTLDHDRAARAIESAGAMRPGHCGRNPPLCELEAFFNEGIFQAASLAQKSGRPGNRRVIIWLTDNVPNIPNDKVHSEAAALDLLRESEVVVCALLEHSTQSYVAATLYSKNPMLAFNRKRHPPGDVGTYTKETGGISVSAGREDVRLKLADLIDRVRSRYTIGYRPLVQKAAGTLCTIEVKLSPAAIKRGEAVEIRARRSYKR